MDNRDIRDEEQMLQNIVDAAKSGDEKQYKDAFKTFFDAKDAEIKAQAEAFRNSSDAVIEAQRGNRQLTSAERDFYAKFITAARTGEKALNALSGVEKTFPSTIITAVLDDMKQNHPLLSAVDTMNVAGLTEILLNTDAGAAATWGTVTDAIATEIASGFKKIELSQNKLSAFMPISMGMLDLGPVWLDNYIRTCLSEALALGYENAIVTGTGNSQPIGMDRSVADDVTVTGGVYPQKEAIAVTDFGRASYGNLVAQLAKTQYGKARAVTGLVLVCNPQDYFKLVLPATTLLTPEGQYVNNVLPYPTTIIQSVAVESGKAILGIGKNYFLGVAGGRGIQFSDDYKFLEDQRYYKVTGYGNGRPKDNTSFLRLDISKLAPTYLEVKQVTG